MVDRSPSHTLISPQAAVNSTALEIRGGSTPAVAGGEELRPDVIDHLEALDDVIFAAIDGDQSALQRSAAAWHRAVKTLGHDTIEETRRQYLRHAQCVWEELRHQSVQPPHKIFAAIEIIGLLVNSER
jgi:hypothetical protein